MIDLHKYYYFLSIFLIDFINKIQTNMPSSQVRPMSAMTKIAISSENFKQLPLSQIQEENCSSKLKRTRLTSAKSSNHMHIPAYSQLQVSKTMKGISNQFHKSRKENYLNSCFNKRKNDLLRITKENRKIYERINSQQSNYSTKKGNKSMESHCSKSRVSARSSSKISNSKNISRPGSALKIGRRRILKENNFLNEKPLIEEKNVHKINEAEVKKFQNMFFESKNDEIPASGVSLPMRRPKTVKREKLQKKEQKENRQFCVQKDKSRRPVSRKKSKKLNIKHINCLQNRRGSLKKHIFIGLGMQNSARNDKLTKILSELGFKYQYC